MAMIVEDLTPYRKESCKCQVKLAILLEEGEIVSTRILGRVPFFLRDINHVKKFYEIEEVNNEIYYKDNKELKLLSSLIPVKKFNGKWFVEEDCGVFSESFPSYDELKKLLEDDFESEINESGLFITILQNDCFVYRGFEGNEYDGEVNLKIIKHKIK